MEYRNLGDSGLKVSLAGLGCHNFGWTLDWDQSESVIRAALDSGINFFDTLAIGSARSSRRSSACRWVKDR